MPTAVVKRSSRHGASTPVESANMDAVIHVTVDVNESEKGVIVYAEEHENDAEEL